MAYGGRSPAAMLLLVGMLLSLGTVCFAQGFGFPTGFFANEILPSNLTGVPDLLHKSLSNPERQCWNKAASKLWSAVITDQDNIDVTTGLVMPDGYPNTRLEPSPCGRLNRIWIRMPFHDCGTFDKKTKQYGCDGSLRLEIFPSPATAGLTQALSDPVPNGLGLKEGYDFDLKATSYFENSGFEASVFFFHWVKSEMYRFSRCDLSWVDIQTLGGFLSTFKCGGPLIQFYPGRKDTYKPNPPGRLTAPTANISDVIKRAKIQGLSEMDICVLLSSHSCASFRAGRQDKTPQKYDNQWAKEVLTFTGSPGDTPKCFNPDFSTNNKTGACHINSDIALKDNYKTLQCLALLSYPAKSIPPMESAVAALVGAVGYKGYKGFCPEVNLCTKEKCGNDQYVLNHLFATSYFRQTCMAPNDEHPICAKYNSKKCRGASRYLVDDDFAYPSDIEWKGLYESSVAGWKAWRDKVGEAPSGYKTILELVQKAPRR